MLYDKTDKYSIEKYAQKLVGKHLMIFVKRT